MTETKKTLNEVITDLITSHTQEIPSPTPCTITHIYEDGKVDINTDKYGELKYIDTITEHTEGDTTVLLFLNQSIDERIVI